MANNFLIPRETFKDYSTENKLITLYDISVAIYTHNIEQNGRIEALERRRVKDTAFSGGMGILGGFIAVVLKLKWWP